eukprot:TRINITY_DN673_c0_g1_i5.p1 TRINITY_DN673_c0_g1~~TRINITY_DN673_c0_g1_i5.p1  ORF type:complete len:1047 (-),score=101.59 TRINITY_DN673_c0_g1_i5:8613-11663(-)
MAESESCQLLQLTDHMETLIMENVSDLNLCQIIEKSSRTKLLRFAEYEADRKVAVVVKKAKGLDSNYKARWTQKINQAFDMVSLLSHKGLAQIYSYLFTESRTACEILCENAGIPLKTFAGEKTAKLCKDLLDQTLDVLAYLEKHGILLIGDMLDLIMIDPITGSFKILVNSSNRMLSRWSAKGSYRKINKEYAAPEIAETLPEIGDNSGKCFSELIPPPDYLQQAVYSWGIAMYKFLTGKPCPLNKVPETYDTFLTELDTVSFRDDLKGDVMKTLRPFVKSALSYYPKDRPTFHTLLLASKAAESRTETEVSEIIKLSCPDCGHLLNSLKCEFCTSIKESTSSIPEKIKENPHAVIRLFPTLKLSKHALFTLFPVWAEQFKKVSSDVCIEFLLAMILYEVKAQASKRVVEFIEYLLAIEISSKGIDLANALIANIELVDMLLPQSMLPNFLTINERNGQVDHFKVQREFKGIIDRIMQQNLMIKGRMCIPEYTQQRIYEQMAKYSVAFNNGENADTKLEKFKEAVKNCKKVSKFEKLCITERLLRVALEAEDVELAEDTLERVIELIALHYSLADCTEYVNVFKTAIRILRRKYSDAQITIGKYWKGKRRAGNKMNELLMTYYDGLVSFNANKLAEALQKLQAIPSRPFAQYFPEILLPTYLKICGILIEQQKFGELYKYAKEATEISKNPEALLYYSCALRARKSDSEAVKVLEQAFTIVKSPDYTINYLVKTMVLFDMANELFRSQKVQKAYELYQEAQIAYMRIEPVTGKKSKLLPKILLNMANAERTMKLYPKAISSYETAIQKAKEIYGLDSEHEVRPLVNLGTLESQLGDDVKGATRIREACDIMAKNGLLETDLYKHITQIGNKVKEHGRKPIQEPIRMPTAQVFNLSPEQETIRDIILDMLAKYNYILVIGFISSLTVVMHEILEVGTIPYILPKHKEPYKTLMVPIPGSSLLLDMLGFKEEKDKFVMDKPNREFLLPVYNLLGRLINSNETKRLMKENLANRSQFY